MWNSLCSTCRWGVRLHQFTDSLVVGLRVAHPCFSPLSEVSICWEIPWFWCQTKKMMERARPTWTNKKMYSGGGVFSGGPRTVKMIWAFGGGFFNIGIGASKFSFIFSDSWWNIPGLTIKERKWTKVLCFYKWLSSDENPPPIIVILNFYRFFTVFLTIGKLHRKIPTSNSMRCGAHSGRVRHWAPCVPQCWAQLLSWNMERNSCTYVYMIDVCVCSICIWST